MPFIQLEKGKLCFVKLTSNNVGYKHLRFTDSTITELSTSASVARGKSKRKVQTVTIDERFNIVMNMKLTRGHTSTKPEGTGPPNGSIPLSTTNELRKIIGKYVNEDGVFPYKKINLLRNKLHRDEIKKNPPPEPEPVEEEKVTNTFSDSTSADRKRKKKKRVMKKKSRKKTKKKKRKRR